MLSTEEMILRLVLAACLGSVIGFERERNSFTAGLRTHMLVCVGACLFMIVSAFGFSDILGTNHVVLDPSRIAAQVVSGIGFLGAGAILTQGETIRGLTTAASVWTAAAIGLAAGSGLYEAGVVATGMIVLILAGIKPLEVKYRDRRQGHTLCVLAKKGELTIDLLKQTAGTQALRIRQFTVKTVETSEYDDVTLVFSRLQPWELDAVIERLSNLPCVSEVKERKVEA